LHKCFKKGYQNISLAKYQTKHVEIKFEHFNHCTEVLVIKLISASDNRGVNTKVLYLLPFSIGPRTLSLLHLIVEA